MNQLDRWAELIGGVICKPLSPWEQYSLYDMVCADGAYSAGWKLFGMAMVFLGLALAWATLGSRRM